MLGEGGAGESPWRPQRVLSSTPSGSLSLSPEEFTAAQEPGQLCCITLTREAEKLVSVFCHHPPLHITRALEALESVLGPSNKVAPAILLFPLALLMMPR